MVEVLYFKSGYIFNSYEISVFRLVEICYTKYSYSAKREELDYEIKDA